MASTMSSILFTLTVTHNAICSQRLYKFIFDSIKGQNNSKTTLGLLGQILIFPYVRYFGF